MFMHCEVILIVRFSFRSFLHPHQRQQHLHLTLIDAIIPMHSITYEGGVQEGASRWLSTNRDASSDVTVAQPIGLPRLCEGGPYDVTMPPGQLKGLPPVLASESDGERSGRQNWPVTGRRGILRTRPSGWRSGEGGDNPPLPWGTRE